MNNKAIKIITDAINENKPDALSRYFKDCSLQNGRLYVVAFGKAAWLMAKQAEDFYGSRIDCGIVITKYHHSQGELAHFEIHEAGHPIVDQNSIKATERLLELTANLRENDDVIVLVSGGGSALLESPVCSLDELQKLNNELIRSEKSIDEINAIRKQYSKVKGGKLAEHFCPAQIHNFILSDVVSQDLSNIASGPTINDQLSNIENIVIGSCQQLAQSAKKFAEENGYEVTIVNDSLQCHFPEAKELIANCISANQNSKTSKAFIFAGEITIAIKGNGKGGRNQHLALSLFDVLSNTANTSVYCVGSDGTDGPTDAAGGYCDSNTFALVKEKRIDISSYLENCDSYHALEKLNQLVITGPTNTNVNDLYIVFIDR